MTNSLQFVRRFEKKVIMFYDENISFLNMFTLLDFVGVLKTLKNAENAKFVDCKWYIHIITYFA